LAGDDITKVLEIEDMSFLLILNFLSRRKELNQKR